MTEEIESWFVTPDGRLVATITRITNVDPAKAENLVRLAGSTVMGGLAAHTARPEKLQELYHLVKSDHVNEHYATQPEKFHEQDHLLKQGKPLSEAIFGDKLPSVTEHLAKEAGVSHEAATGALEAVTPVGLGNVKHQVNKDQLDASKLGELLTHSSLLDKVLGGQLLTALGLGGLGAASDVTGKLAEHGKKIAQQASDKLQSATDKLHTAKDTATLAGQVISDKAASIVSNAANQAREPFHKAGHVVGDATDAAQEKLNQAAGSVSNAANKFGEKASETADKIADASARAYDKASDAVESGTNKAREMAKDAKVLGQDTLKVAEDKAKELEDKLKSGGGKWLWIILAIAAVVLLLWFLRSCGHHPDQEQVAAGTTTSEPATTTASSDGSSSSSSNAGASAAAASNTATLPSGLDFKWKDGKLDVEGTVANEDSKKAIMDAMTAAVGADKVTDNLKVDSSAPAVDSAAAQKLATWMKDYPGLSVEFDDGNKVKVSGTASSEADKTNAADALKAALGSGYTVENDIKVDTNSQTATNSTTKAPSAAGEKVVLDVDFPSGSATIAPKYDSEIQSFAKQLVDTNASGEIAGYTDNTGNEKTNQAVSLKRANAVMQALVKNGVAADKLTAKGYGSADPIADNQTPEGRAQNRRVVFVRAS